MRDMLKMPKPETHYKISILIEHNTIGKNVACQNVGMIFVCLGSRLTPLWTTPQLAPSCGGQIMNDFFPTFKTQSVLDHALFFE